MNLPNRLTLLRIILVPFFVIFLLWPELPYSGLVALLIFIVASITDYFDGKIARQRNMITNFGKLLDPMADKLLVLSGMICMIPMELCHPAAAIIVIARELLISSFRLIAASQSIVITAGWSGKIKTASQMISIVVILAIFSINQLFGTELPIEIISNFLMWITAAIAVYSGVEYLIKNRRLINVK